VSIDARDHQNVRSIRGIQHLIADYLSFAVASTPDILMVSLLDGDTVAELAGDGATILRPSGARLTMRRGSRRPAAPVWKMIR
jgi:hypothetical protein